MIKTHELDVTASKFSELLESNYKIIKQNDYEQNDYILFREIETVEEEVNYTSVSYTHLDVYKRQDLQPVV